jgi:hypothetical protein
MSGSGKTARPGSKTLPTKISLVIYRKGIKVKYNMKRKEKTLNFGGLTCWEKVNLARRLRYSANLHVNMPAVQFN